MNHKLLRKSTKEETFVRVMYATVQAFKALYFEDCIIVTVNPYSVIRNWIDGVINGLRPDSSNETSYRVRFVESLDLDIGRIHIDLNLLDNKCNPFYIGFMSDWTLKTETLYVDNYSRFRSKIITKEKMEFNVLDENLFTDLTQMIKGLVRSSIKKLE